MAKLHTGALPGGKGERGLHQQCRTHTNKHTGQFPAFIQVSYSCRKVPFHNCAHGSSVLTMATSKVFFTSEMNAWQSAFSLPSSSCPSDRSYQVAMDLGVANGCAQSTYLSFEKVC